MTAELARLRAENDELRAVIARIRAAIEFAPPPDQLAFDQAIGRSIADGLSLRVAAKKHATTVGRVRGALARLEKSA